jgi:hypothetical protein
MRLLFKNLDGESDYEAFKKVATSWSLSIDREVVGPVVMFVIWWRRPFLVMLYRKCWLHKSVVPETSGAAKVFMERLELLKWRNDILTGDDQAIRIVQCGPCSIRGGCQAASLSKQVIVMAEMPRAVEICSGVAEEVICTRH